MIVNKCVAVRERTRKPEEEKLPTEEDYKGNMKDGMRNGRGICYYPNGDKYDGEWKDDLKDGRGIISFNIL